MNLRKFGRTNFDVSDVGYGLWGMSGWSGSDDEQSRNALQISIDLGCNFFDTAWAYGEGKSDALLGEALEANRNKCLYSASKVPPKNRKWPASPRYSYEDSYPAEHVFEYSDRIRKQLKTDSIDLLQFHTWDDTWADDPEFAETVLKLKRDGVIRAFGISLNRWQPENGIRVLQTGLVDTVQVVYNIFDQAPEDVLFPLCKELNVSVIARVPLDEGSLGGKLTAETKFPENDWRSTYFNPENLRATLERVERLKSILPSGMTLPEMAIRFILSHPVVSTTIVGMRNPNHVRQNLALSDAGPLPADLIRELRKHRWDRKLNVDKQS